jgi:hypothetical protein
MRHSDCYFEIAAGATYTQFVAGAARFFECRFVRVNVAEKRRSNKFVRCGRGTG